MKLSHAERLESWIFVSTSGSTSGLAGSGPVAWLWRKTDGQGSRRKEDQERVQSGGQGRVHSDGLRVQGLQTLGWTWQWEAPDTLGQTVSRESDELRSQYMEWKWGHRSGLSWSLVAKGQRGPQRWRGADTSNVKKRFCY